MAGAVITGAASGIGRGLAREAASRGYRLVLADRDADALAGVAAELPDALAVPTDVTDRDAVFALAEAAFDRLETVDLLFNNAGVMATGLSWEISAERWQQSLDVNIGGIVHGLAAFVPRMIAAGTPSRIINTSSVGGFMPSPLMAPYSATKFAALALTESLKAELDMIGAPVAVSLLAPGPVSSGIFDDPFGGRDIDAATQGFVDTMREMVVENGMDADAFAVPVFEAIERGEYWIIPQPEALDERLEARNRMIASRTSPTFALD